MEEEMEKEKNMINQEIQYLKENFFMINIGTEKKKNMIPITI